jgi:glycosyltransferase involved in cell wall biosynthesis
MIIVEPGIGYPGGSFARFRVFESYAILHAYRGLAAVERAGNDHWYDAVIPNFFDGAEFPNNMPDWGPPWSDSDLLLYGNYLMFCGRVNTGKGIHVAEQIAAETKRVLVVAGQGDFEFTKGAKIEQVGVISPADRAQLMGGAMATLCPSTFLEPFCGVQIESMLCGTPVISSDWGAFAEYNIHGKTGYRCRTFEQFLFAVEQAPALNPDECRTHGERFLIENVAPLYDEYFWSVNQVFAGTGGWYAPKVRKDLRNITWNGEYVGA